MPNVHPNNPLTVPCTGVSENTAFSSGVPTETLKFHNQILIPSTTNRSLHKLILKDDRAHRINPRHMPSYNWAHGQGSTPWAIPRDENGPPRYFKHGTFLSCLDLGPIKWCNRVNILKADKIPSIYGYTLQGPPLISLPFKCITPFGLAPSPIYKLQPSITVG